MFKVIPNSRIRHYPDFISLECRILGCNDYFRVKPIFVNIKSFEIQEKGDWSLNMTTCLQSSSTLPLISYSRIQCYNNLRIILLQSRFRVSPRICYNQYYCNLRCFNLDFPILQNYDEEI